MSIVLLGSTSGSITLSEPAVAGTNTLSLPAVTGTLVVQGQNSAITSGTAVASTSGTSIDFTSIPSWVKRITVMFSGVSTSGTSVLLVQIGDSGGIEATGYLGSASNLSTGVTSANYTTGFGCDGAARSATDVTSGFITICNLSSNTWVANGTLARTDSAGTRTLAGTKGLTDVLDRIRITTVNGTDTFDAGSINILYE
jgi:hypothetical protein